MDSRHALEFMEGFRLTLHVLAACVWVGGQIVLAGLVPVVREHSRELLPVIARSFARLAWPAFIVLVVTGVWNVWSYDISSAKVSLLALVFVKISFVAIAGLATATHASTTKPSIRAIGGAAALIASIAALYIGVVLTLSN